MEHEVDYNLTRNADKNKHLSKFTTQHRSSVVRWLSLHDLLTSIEKAYHPSKHVLNEKHQSSRLDKINMNIVYQLIKFLDPWKYVMSEIQVSNGPSLFMTLPCIGYLRQQIAKHERSIKGGMSFFEKRSLQFLQSMFQIENVHVMGTFLHPNYKPLRYATQIQIIDCHASCRLTIPAASSLTMINGYDDINESLRKKPKRFLESLMDDIALVTLPHNKDKVDVYVDLQLKDNEIYENPLPFWQKRESKFPNLPKLAKKIFYVPCSATAVEREFSAAGQIVTQRRASLEPSTINDIIFLRSIENSKKLM